MRRLLSFLVTLLLCQSAWAFTVPKGRPYFGAAIGDQNAKSYNGLYANFFGGYGIHGGWQDKLYLGGEVFLDSPSIPLSHKHQHRTIYGLGASLLPGVTILKDTMAFARVGIATFRYNKHLNYRTGGQLGIGLSTALSENFDIRGEYVYTGKGIYHDFGINRFNFFDLALVCKLK